MSNLIVVNGILTLNGKRYSEMNWFEMKAFDLSLGFEKRMFALKQFENGTTVSLSMAEKKTTPESGKPKFN